MTTVMKFGSMIQMQENWLEYLSHESHLTSTCDDYLHEVYITSRSSCKCLHKPSLPRPDCKLFNALITVGYRFYVMQVYKYRLQLAAISQSRATGRATGRAGAGAGQSRGQEGQKGRTDRGRG